MSRLSVVLAGGMNDQNARFQGVTTPQWTSLSTVSDHTAGHPLETGNLR